jgi:hypothetical protein
LVREETGIREVSLKKKIILRIRQNPIGVSSRFTHVMYTHTSIIRNLMILTK